MIHGILIAHGGISESFLGAIRAMYGATEELTALTNEGLSTPELVERIREVAGAAPGQGICLLVDAFGGSCWRAAKTARIPGSVIVTGLSLPMLLSFVTKRVSLSFAELSAVLDTDARRGITVESIPES